MFFDSHVHFEAEAGASDPGPILRRAADAGVTRIIAVGGSLSLNRGAADAARRCPEGVQAAVGLDRHMAAEWSEAVGRQAALEALRAHMQALTDEGVPVVAVGEMGLDLYYDAGTVDAQAALLQEELALAREAGMPVIIHSRDAEARTLEALSEHARRWRGDADRIGVVHCFTGTREFADRLLGLGFHLSFSGIVTFRNAEALRRVAAAVPEERLLIETDSPYLAPVPHRGKTNEPAFLPEIATCLAAVRSMTVEEVARATCRNAVRLFGDVRATASPSPH